MPQAAFDPILAEAYRRAALAGFDMYAFAGQMERVKAAVGAVKAKPIDSGSFYPWLERVKAAMSAVRDLYEQWNRIDDLIGEALGLSDDPKTFLLVRQVLIDGLGERFTEAILATGDEVDQDWKRWRAAFSEASFHWRAEAMQALCQAPAFQERFGKKLAPFRDFIRYFRDRRWVETRDVFEDLAADADLPEEHRGYHWYVCGQIDLYFHYRYEQAHDLFERAKTLLKDKPLGLHGLIEYYLKGPAQVKSLEEAEKLIEQALQLDPNHAPTIIQKADLLLEKEQLPEAENLYRLASRKRPGHVLCYTRLIDLYGKPEWFAEKERELEPLLNLALQLDPGAGFLVRTDLGTIYQTQGEAYWPKAEACHREAMAEYPEGIMAPLNLGYLYLDISKQYDQAEPLFQQVVRQAPKAREGYLGLARLCEAREDWQGALEHYEKVREIIPSWERFMLASIGHCYRQLGQTEKAEEALLRAWSLDGWDDTGALSELYDLSETLYKDTQNPQLERAVTLLERTATARKAPPETLAGIANRQGHAYFWTERYVEALPCYRKAAGLVAHEPVYYTNQFDCLEKLYRQTLEQPYYEQAQEALNLAEQADRQNADIPKKRRKLALLRYNPHLAELPPLYQIHVEVGQPLLSEITTDYANLLPGIMTLTEDLRLRMKERYGISLPGLRYRDINNGNGAYQFRFYETPVHYDHLPLAEGETPTMAAVLEQLEQFIIQHSLDLFVNYWDVDREVPLLPNAELVQFTRVVMALLAEQIPLPQLPQLYEHYRWLDGQRRTHTDIVEQLRLFDALLANLPGTQDMFYYLPLSENLERHLAACVTGQGSTRVLALPMATVRGFMGAVLRAHQEHAGKTLALVTKQAGLRPYLRSALASLPQMPVLKNSELPAEADKRMLPPLEMQAEDSDLFLQTVQQVQSSVNPEKQS